MTNNSQFNTAQIRRLLNQVFDDPILDAFCQDYFPAVFDRFSRGMRRDEKITLLLDYCRRHSFEALRQAVLSEYEAGDPQNDALKTLADAIGSSSEQSLIVSHSPDTSDREGQPTIDNPKPTSKGATMKDFFVSYNGKDKTWAEWIAWQLEDAGYTTIIQAWDFRPGGNFVIDMQKAAAGAERTIAVLSQNYLNALYTQPEWAAAFAQDPTGEKKTLLPVRVQECELKGMLSQIVYIDFVGKSEAEAREALLAGLKVGRAKPVTAPGFPGSGAPVHTQVAKPAFPEEAKTLSASQSTSTPTPSPLPRFKQVKLKALEDRRETLVKQYEAANRQLSSTFDATSRVVIERQMQNLEQEIEAVENDIDQLITSA